MSRLQQELVVPYRVELMYQLVNAIEAYPEFLPWCNGATMHYCSEELVKATIYVAKGPIKYSFTTENNLQKNELININYVQGPFKYLQGCWHFTQLTGNNSKVSLELDYKFSNKLIELAVAPIFNAMHNNLIDCFYQRARQVYGE